jgi:hypothetical protein
MRMVTNTDFIKTDIAARDALVTLMGARLADNLIAQLRSAGFKLVPSRLRMHDDTD